MHYNLRKPYPNELYHYGIEGMHWGQRRYQNYDGTLTSAGKKRYETEKLNKVAILKPYDIERKGNRKNRRVSAKYYSDEDYAKLNKKEKKILKKTEKGRNAFATNQYMKELNSKEYINSRDEAVRNTKGIKNKLKVINDYEQNAAIKAVSDASKISMDQAMAEYNKAMKDAAIKAGVGVGSYAALMYIVTPGTKANNLLVNSYFKSAQNQNTDFDIVDELAKKR